MWFARFDTLPKRSENFYGPNERDRPMMAEDMRRIAIVDDHEVVRFGTAQLIGRQPGWTLVGEAADCASAMRVIRETSPELVIVDLRLPGGDGLELIKQIRASFPEVRTLVCSMQDEQLFAERAIRAGASGFVSKHESVQTLIEAIQKVLDGRVSLSPDMTEQLLNRTAGRAPTVESPLALLSDREMEVFERLGRGQSVKQIAADLHLSVKTVEYHRQHIKEKLKVASSSAVVRLATTHVLGLSRESQKPPEARL
jgi:DNA-binding NarL/FixJ family response regulator